MHKSWPGLDDAKDKDSSLIPAIIEPAIASSIIDKLSDSFNPEKFIPYIQVYELETLLFAGPEEMANVFEKPRLKEHFEKIVIECGGCENINSNPSTAPSKRIEHVFPSYKKGGSVNSHAPIIASRIGIERIRRSCPNFDRWLSKLERLSTGSNS